MLRREFLAGLAALTASPVLADGAQLRPGTGQPFDPNDVVTLARARAEQPYRTRQSVP